MLPGSAGFAKLLRSMLSRIGSDRWLVAFLLVACVLLLVGLGAQRHLSSFAGSLQQRLTQQQRFDQLVRLRHALEEAEVAHAQHLSRRDPQSSQALEDARRALQARLASLRASHDPQSPAGELLIRIDALLAQHAAQWDASPVLAAAQVPAGGGASGTALPGQLDALFAELERTQQRELDDSVLTTEAQTRALMQRMTWAMAAGILLVLALAGLHARESYARARAQAQAGEAQRALEDANAELKRANESYLLALDEIAYRHLLREDRIEWSGAYTKVLGYHAEEMGSAAAQWRSRVHPDDLPRVQHEYDRALRERTLFELDYRFRHRDGHWRWMYDRGVLHCDETGTPTELIGVFRDVTALRTAQAEREASVTRLNGLLDHMSEGFVVLDRDGRYIAVNARACTLLRSGREALIGQPVWTRFPDDASASVRAASALSIEDGRARHLEIFHEPWQQWFETDIYPSPEGLTYFFRDITQRKHAERTLRDSKAQQELARWEVGVWEWDLQSGRVYLSPEWKSQLGHADDEIANTFEEWEQRLHPEEREDIVGRLRTATARFTSGERFELEFRLRHKDGGYRWILSRGELHADPAGTPVLLRGVHLDITDRKRAEQERGDVQRRLQHIIASIRDGFVALDRDWNYSYVNDAAAQLLGRPREELVGHNIWALFPELKHLPFHDACMRCVQQREPMHLDQYYAPHFRWYRNHFYPTDDGVAIFFEDFTVRKRLEAQLADERERYRATFEQPALGILHVALEGTITRANARMADMLGYGRLDLVGVDFARILGEPQAREFLEDVQRPARGSAGRLVQCRFLRSDGERFWGEMTLAFVPGEGERSGYVVCMVHDIEDRKRAETLLEESRQRLNVFAQQLTEAIEQERARISREIHDELGQALTRLKMDLGWLRRRLGESGQTGGPVAERVLEMGRFIDDTLVSVRRLATELRPALLDNLGLAAALNAQMRQLSAQADIEVTQHLEPDLPLSSEQATGLYRIAQEAVTNIVRHAQARSVRCVLFLDQEGVTMEIQDDGRGFDMAAQPRRGLGLVGMAERARLLGGSAAVESEPGRGTLVRVHLPTETAVPDQAAG